MNKLDHIIPCQTTIKNEAEQMDNMISFLSTYRSSHTRRAYKTDMTMWFQFLDSVGVRVTDADHRHAAYYMEIISQKCAPTTANRRMTTLAAYYSYIGHQSPTLTIRKHRIDRSVVSSPALTEDEITRLLAVAKDDGARTYALVATLYYTGARISEILNMKTSDLGWDSGYRTIMVTRKGGIRQRLVLNQKNQAALAALGHDADAVVNWNDDRYIFHTATGKKMDQPSIYRMLERLSKKAGLQTKVTPHIMRATHVTIALEKDVPLHHVQESVGHATPTMTMMYNRARQRMKNSSANAL